MEIFNDEDMDEFIHTFGCDLDLSINVLYMNNAYPDVIVHELKEPTEFGVSGLLGKLGISSTATQMVRATTHPACPFVRIYMTDAHKQTSTNFKLETFFHMAGITEVSVRCSAALVIGVLSNEALHTLIDVHADLYIQPLHILEMRNLGEVGLNCVEPFHGLEPLPLYTNGQLTFNLIKKCKNCTQDRKDCNLSLPCNCCRHSTQPRRCIPRDSDHMNRLRVLTETILSNKTQHHDIAKYLLHAQAAQVGGYLMYGLDARGVNARINALPLGPEFPGPFRKNLPESIRRWSREPEVVKIEYMTGRDYWVDCSKEYSRLIMSPREISEKAIKHKAAPKLVDWCGFDFQIRAYENWVVSLYYPGKVCEYTGASHWKDGRVAWTKMRVVSEIFGKADVVTVTWLYRKLD